MKAKLFKKKKQRIAERKTAREQKKIPVKEISLGLALWLIVSYIFYGRGIVSHIDIAEGQRIPSTIVATVDFECENLTETEFNRRKAANAIPPVFTLDPAPLFRALNAADKLFAELQQYHQDTVSNKQATILIAITGLLDGMGAPVNTGDFLEMFKINQISNAYHIVRTDLKNVMTIGILSDEYRRTLFRDSSTKSITIKDPQTGTTRTLPQREIPSVREAVKKISEGVRPLLSNPKEDYEKLKELLSVWVTPNLTYDAVATELLRQEAAQSVEPVIQQYFAGTTLAQAGEPATAQTILLLQAHEQKQNAEEEIFDRIMRIIGNSIQLLAGLIITTLILRIVAPKILHQPDKLLLLSILSMIPLLAAKLLLSFSLRHPAISPALHYLVPHALAVLLTGILVGAAPALCLGLWTSYATANLFGQSFNVFALGLLITVTATSTAHKVHKRSSLFRAGLWVSAIMVLYVLISAILNRPTIHVLSRQLGAAVVNGMLSALTALLLVPLFENLFKITTDITLLELSDMGNPLLQKLAMQAPGTYHHSLMVASLAQTAAERIGANPLLVRVCAYYHDIGKLAKPEFFSENIQHRENPHEDLSPHMSALVIMSHVKEGLTLAKRYKLPRPILDAIEQHHGNSLISFFYQKAKLQQQKETAAAGFTGVEPVNDSDFRYGGKPAISAEMAILSLADATEAASRSIEKPTPTKIAHLVDEIFKIKLNDGQLDNCELTMTQINEIKQSFIFSLTNMLHGRVAYPKEDENYSTQQTAKTSRQKTDGSKTGTMAE